MRLFYKPGDIVTYKEDIGSLYMVIEQWRFKLFVMGVNGKGLIDSNYNEFANFGKLDFGPDDALKRFKKVKIDYDKGSFFDYLHRTIVDKTLEIRNKNPNFKEYIGFVMVDLGINLDPTKNTHEFLYKGNFVEKKGENNNGI